MIYPKELAERMKDKAGQPYTPSNGIEGSVFLDSWCANCQRDKSMREGCDFDECDDDENCELIARSFGEQVDEWQYDKSGQPCCTAFVPAGHAIPEPRCAKTTDMFEDN